MSSLVADQLKRWIQFLVAPVFCAALCVPATSTAIASGDDAEFFEKRVRPILAERCEKCHSQAKAKTSGGLALDTRQGWLNGGDSGSPIVPGQPDDSLLVVAVRYGDDGPQMPPADAGGKLSDAEIAILVEWVSRGAPDPRTAAPRIGGMNAAEAQHWWSFQKVRPSEPPPVRHTAWPRNEIDRFVLARLESEELIPTVEEGRRRWLRRATYDLTGLPPMPDELADFLLDNTPEAFARVIDRLLASPAYGQRYARHWLDVVRYADYYDANPQTRTASCELTEAWRYRDWVIDSLNRDFPFDRFLVHQIAGDLLPSPSGEEVYADGLIATTFLSNGVWDRGDADKEKIISDMVDDNIDTIGKAFLGLTFGCARCHDHKFDPITTEDYYALAGIFYSTHILEDLGAKGAEYVMNRVPLVPAAVVAKRREQEQQLAAATAKLDEFDRRQRYLDLVAEGTTLVPSSFQSAAGATAVIATDGVVTVTGNGGKDVYTLRMPLPADEAMRFLRLEALADSTLPQQGPGRAADGNFVVTRLTVALENSGTPAAQPVNLVAANADFEQSGLAASGMIDDDPRTGWGILPAKGQDHAAVFELAMPLPLAAGAVLIITIEQQHADNLSLGKFRLSLARERSRHLAENDVVRNELVSQRERISSTMLPPTPLAMAVQEGGMRGGLFPKIQDVPIHIRGSYARLGAVVPRRLPNFFVGHQQPAIASGSGRRELAAWVASPDNPLTARVIVNRVWQWHFGEGLVRTPNNFGKLGESPTHPALLDWLAHEFVMHGWSLKWLHRQIMLSATYRQASEASRDALDKDPENRLLGRFVPRRLEAEALRDAMLAVAGTLDRTMRGPAGDDLNVARRSIYVQTARWDRSGYATLFDAANPDSSAEKRTVSTVAPQALLLLNHPFAWKQAKHLAERLLREAPDDRARVELAYELLFGRPASTNEIEIARRLVGTMDSDQALERWTDLAHVLLCSNEFVYID